MVLSLPGSPAERKKASKIPICGVTSSLVAATYANKYVSLLGISAALHLGIFEQPKGRISFCFAVSLLRTGGFNIENYERTG
jgi:hypothetical protein